MDNPVDPKIVGALTDQFADFDRAYSENGISVDDFDTFGATLRTLRQFLAAGAELNAVIRDYMVPNPDKI
jgi:transaldolase